MSVVHKNQCITKQNSSSCSVDDYPIPDQDINGAVARIDGRYPDAGRVINATSKEMAYVVEGSGKVVIEGVEHSLNKGDVVLITAGKKYYWEGHMSLFLACTPSVASRATCVD